MFFSPRRQRLSIWFALLATLLSALAPAVSHAMPAWGSRSGWVDICSTNRDQAQPQADGGATGQGMSGLGVDCAYCLVQAHQPALPVTAASALTAQPVAPLQGARNDTAQRPRLAWASARPRGPPVPL